MLKTLANQNVRDLTIVLVGRGLQVITSLLTLRLLTWRLEQVEMGKLAILTVLVTFFALVFINPVGMYINRQLHTWNREGTVLRHFGFAFLYLCVVSLVAVCLLSLTGDLLVSLIDISRGWLIALVVISLFSNTINQTIIPSLNLLGKRLQWMVFTLVSLWIGLIASVMLTGVQADAAFWMVGQISGYSLGVILAVVSFLAALDHSGQVLPDSSTKSVTRSMLAIRPVIIFAIPLSITVLLNWFQFQSFRLFFGEMESLARLGVFAAGYAVSAGIMGAFESTAVQYFSPKFYQDLDTSDRDEQIQAWARYASFLIPITILVFVFIVVMAAPLLRLLVDEKYWGAGHFVIVAALLEASRVIGNAYALAGHAIKDTRILIIPQGVGAVSVLIIVPLLMMLFGETGFLLALGLASAAYLIVIRWVVQRHTRVRLPLIDGWEVPVGILALGIIWGISGFLPSGIFVSVGVLAAAGLICAGAGWRFVSRLGL